MTALIKGVIVSGTPEEIKKLIDLYELSENYKKQKQKQKQISVDVYKKIWIKNHSE